jgi:hypothetical protein
VVPWTWTVLEVPWTVLDVPWTWTVLDKPQLNPLPHKLAASTGWFFSVGSEANNDAVANATKAKTEIFFTVLFMLSTMQRYSLYEIRLTRL